MTGNVKMVGYRADLSDVMKQLLDIRQMVG
jgi:hypothetical protein